MATVIGVRFKKAGKVYYFDPSDVWPRPGDNVVVETARGVEFGEVVTGAREVADEQIVAPLKKVVRVATEEDVRRAEYNAKREEEAFRICLEKVAKHKLEMKLVSVEYTFDNSKIIFYFTANGRVDFRELVKDLASVFKMRIELRQIGVRDEAKMLGGLGSCGRPICCGTFLGDFQPVSIKMAKEQNLSLNPTKISGLCGRLMCCLKYEQDYYSQTLKKLPKVGKDIVTPDGVGVLSEINAIRECVKVRIKADDSFDVREYPISEVRKPGPDDSAAVREAPKPCPRRPEPEPEAAEEEQPKRKKYPHQKAPKNLSTDQFLEKLKTDAETGGRKKGDRPKKERPPREKRRAKGEAAVDGANAPAEQAAPVKAQNAPVTAGGPEPSAPSPEKAN
ncbi:MAG TPA: stage 0 sporulation family protein [Candidatus Pullichristensenella stercorigallinarum]|uniref:Stage 0 sporulation family protein n=1 Tax=Candidatus Pullichristensenella stercorigallinarum TaxID=2840909 RepID=A0A9D1CWG9_9FIRM|nr:stage 0 sporulation family protein [Candidatus Pullichristensenella stercorigallinarum]